MMAKQSPATKVTNWSPEELMKCSDYVKDLVFDLEGGQFFGVSYEDEGEERNEDVQSAIESARELQNRIEVLHDYLRGRTFGEPFLCQIVFDVVVELQLLTGMLRNKLLFINLSQRIETIHEAMRAGFETYERPLLEFAAKCSTYAQSSVQNLQLLNAEKPKAGHKQADAPKRMTKGAADVIARLLDKADPQFKHGEVEEWAKRIRDYQTQETGVLWSCSASTVHKTDFFQETMQQLGRSRKSRSVASVRLSDKANAKTTDGESVANELIAQEEKHAIETVMNSRMTDREKAAVIESIRNGTTSSAQAIALTREVTKGRKSESRSIANSREWKKATFSANSASC